MELGSRERYKRLKNTDEERNKLIEELLAANDDLKSKLDKATQRLERDSDSVEMYQHRAKEAVSRFEALEKLSSSSTYTCVLIDGDEIAFNDQFIHGAAPEGQNAARMLRGAIKEYINELGIRQDSDIVVYIYANMYTLAKKFRDSHGDIDRFVSGFNSTYSLINLIDGGNVQGNVKSKIGELFRLHIKNLQCQHVVLGVSTGDGYASLLQAFVGDKNFAKRITLLKGASSSQELLGFSSHFRNTAFPLLFRTSIAQRPSDSPQWHQKALAHADLANHQTPEDRFLDSLEADKGRNTIIGVAKHDAEEQRSTVLSDRRSSLRDSAGARLHHNDDTDANSGRSDSLKVAYPAIYFLDAPFGFIARNRRGQRVDVPLTKPDVGRLYDIKSRKICNDYVFRKKCRNNHCRHEHPTNLSEQDYHALREVARSFPCSIGLWCDDTFCHSSHRCPVDPCGFLQDRNCRYPPELHETDTGIVNLEELKSFRDSYDETRILGVKSSHSKESASTAPVSGHREPLFRNLSKVFDNGAGNGSKMINLPVIGEPISPLKRTADEAIETNDTSQQSRLSPPAITRDPRVGAQKRLRGLSP